ncbi:lactococcin 972 family bacteriocin [Streptomyces sp. NPDC091279]|uniref:lactococcin 972 family bacteriocin n=1 Tax=Streptomyces sp. NPDC091279 TaxID=3365983 RepID=UPI0037FBD13B
MVTIDLSDDSPTLVKPTATKDVGGGSWSYGSVITTTGQKRCYSHYFHGGKSHSATVQIGGASRKVVELWEVTAKAELTAGAALQCNAYWATYDLPKKP